MKRNYWAILTVLAIVISLGASGCEVPSGPSNDGSENTGTRLLISLTTWEGYVDVWDGLTVNNFPATMTMRMESTGIRPDSFAETDLYVEQYTLDFLPVDPDCVPLTSVVEPLGAWVTPDDITTMSGIPFVPADTIDEYAAAAAMTVEAIYNVHITVFATDTW